VKKSPPPLIFIPRVSENKKKNGGSFFREAGGFETGSKEENPFGVFLGEKNFLFYFFRILIKD